MRVLVVDDEPALREGLRYWLTKRHFEVSTASDLQSAIGRATDGKPEAILLDVKLGPEDGLQLIELLKSRGLNIPCVVLTANAGPYDGFKAHGLGVISLIEKPSSPDEIAAALRRAVQPAIGQAAGNHGEGPTSNAPASRSAYVASTVRLIQSIFKTRGLSLESIARAVEVSPGHLGKRFRHEMRCSVIAYVHRQRVAHAAHLLKTTTMSVKAVADECGYHSSSELHRHFIRRYGAPPLSFRARESEQITVLDNHSSE